MLWAWSSIQINWWSFFKNAFQCWSGILKAMYKFLWADLKFHVPRLVKLSIIIDISKFWRTTEAQNADRSTHPAHSRSSPSWSCRGRSCRRSAAPILVVVLRPSGRRTWSQRTPIPNPWRPPAASSSSQSHLQSRNILSQVGLQALNCRYYVNRRAIIYD